MPNAIANLIEDARHQSAAAAIYDERGDVRHVIAKPAAASVSTLSLRELTLPPFVKGTDTHIPMGIEAGKKITLSAALLTASRVAKAGASIILIENAPDPAQSIPGGGIVWQKRNTGFACIEPADFELVPDADPDAEPEPLTGEVSTGTLAVYRDQIDLDTIPAYGFRVELSRADQKSFEDGVLADNALASIALGIARAADKALLSAIVESTPEAFTLAAAAEAGLEFSELRALVGTDAEGAAVGEDGTLRAAGVLAELTPTIAETVVGSFARSAVAVHEDIRLVAERTNVQGDLILTCWVNLQALLPLPGAFWTVEA